MFFTQKESQKCQQAQGAARQAGHAGKEVNGESKQGGKLHMDRRIGSKRFA